MKQTDGVRCDGVSKPRMEFLCYGRAAHNRATFDDSHLQPGAGEVSSAGEAIVARTNDHYVTLIPNRSEDLVKFRRYTQASYILRSIATYSASTYHIRELDVRFGR